MINRANWLAPMWLADNLAIAKRDLARVAAARKGITDPTTLHAKSIDALLAARTEAVAVWERAIAALPDEAIVFAEAEERARFRASLAARTGAG